MKLPGYLPNEKCVTTTIFVPHCPAGRHMWKRPYFKNPHECSYCNLKVGWFTKEVKK